MKGKTQQAAAASDMSERSVRNWNKGPLPSEKSKDRRRKSTRPDPFAGVEVGVDRESRGCTA